MIVHFHLKEIKLLKKKKKASTSFLRGGREDDTLYQWLPALFKPRQQHKGLN